MSRLNLGRNVRRLLLAVVCGLVSGLSTLNVQAGYPYSSGYSGYRPAPHYSPAPVYKSYAPSYQKPATYKYPSGGSCHKPAYPAPSWSSYR